MFLLENGYALSFPEGMNFDDDELFAFCQANPELNIERNKNKQLLIMSPAGSLSGFYHFQILMALGKWNENKDGYVFDSSTGFTLPDGSMRSPDVAWVSSEKWNKLTLNQKEKFAPICPEFVVEVASPSDSIKELKNKMIEWVANGIGLGWLIDVKEEQTFIYSTNRLTGSLDSFDNILEGNDVLPGFTFDLKILRKK